MLPVLTTPRLVLRPATDADVDAVWRMLVLAQVRRYLCDDKVLARDTVAAIMADVPHETMGHWIIEDENGFAGLASLKPVAQVLVELVPMLGGEVEPTIALLPARWGQGRASEALGAVLAHGFGPLGLARIAAVCDLPNTASARMLARAGFQPTGEHQGVFYRIQTWTRNRPA